MEMTEGRLALAFFAVTNIVSSVSVVMLNKWIYAQYHFQHGAHPPLLPAPQPLRLPANDTNHSTLCPRPRLQPSPSRLRTLW